MAITMNNFKPVVVDLNQEISNSLNKYDYLIGRSSDDVARQLSKDTSFGNIQVQRDFKELVQHGVDYDDLKDFISTNVVRPVIIEKFSESATVFWSVNYGNTTVTINYNGMDYNRTETINVGLAREFLDEMRELSINQVACENVYDRIGQSYPGIDTQAYKEFMEFFDEIRDTNQKKKKALEAEFVYPWLAQNHPESLKYIWKWRLVFEDGRIEVTYKPTDETNTDRV